MTKKDLELEVARVKGVAVKTALELKGIRDALRATKDKLCVAEKAVEVKDQEIHALCVKLEERAGVVLNLRDEVEVGLSALKAKRQDLDVVRTAREEMCSNVDAIVRAVVASEGESLRNDYSFGGNDCGEANTVSASARLMVHLLKIVNGECVT